MMMGDKKRSIALDRLMWTVSRYVLVFSTFPFQLLVIFGNLNKSLRGILLWEKNY